MGFRLAPKLVILNDFERRNDHFFCVISPILVAFVANYVKVVDWPSTDFLQRNVIKYTKARRCVLCDSGASCYNTSVSVKGNIRINVNKR